MIHLLRLVKLGVLPFGALFRERRHGLVILIYHRIGGGSDSEIDLPTALFAKQMAYLHENYPLMSLNSLLQDPPQFEGGADYVAVTFDDGCLETYTKAFPILQRYRIPATVYVATRFVETGVSFDFGGYRNATSSPRPLNWSQLREMLDSGLITVGSHAHNHVDLSRELLGVVRKELERSRGTIEDRLGVMPLHFAYPWGVVTPTVRLITGQFFRTAAAGGTGKNIPGSMDLLALRRTPIQRTDGFALFRLKIKSYLDGEEIFRTLHARLKGGHLLRSDLA